VELAYVQNDEQQVIKDDSKIRATNRYV